MNMQKRALMLLILALAAALCGCAQKQSDDQLYHKLLTVFSEAGYAAALEELPPETSVPIYDASVWKALKAGEETVLVYFDESNRADYLLTMLDQEKAGYATHFGQRFVLCYTGENAELKAFLETIE